MWRYRDLDAVEGSLIDRLDRLRKALETVHDGHDDVLCAHAAGVERDDLLVETGEPAAVLLDQLRLK